jgi:hypothetical protein
MACVNAGRDRRFGVDIMSEYWTSLVTALVSMVTVAALAAGAVQWFDLRRRELRQRRWVEYNTLLAQVSGVRPDGSKVQAMEQIVAMYQLLQFEEYAFLTVRALDSLSQLVGPDDAWSRQVGPHRDCILDILRKDRGYIIQARRFPPVLASAGPLPQRA